MNKQIAKKATSILLFMTMAFSSFSGIAPMQVNATSYVNQINLGINGISNPATPSGTNVWTGDYLYFGKNIKWRILDKNGNGGNSSADNGILLQADSVIKTGTTEKTMNYSDAKTWLNSTSSDGFLAYFNSKEQESIIQTSNTAASTTVSFLNSTGIDNESVFLLDAQDLENNSYGYKYDETDESFNCNIDSKKPWWLRSTYKNHDDIRGCVFSSGMPYYSFASESRAIVPAMNIKKRDILFTSAKEFNKKSNLAKVPTGNSPEWKLTLKDTRYSVTAATGTGIYNGVIRKEQNGKSIINVPYSATVFDACQLSLIITSGNYETSSLLYYGKIADLFTGNSTDDVQFTLPTDYKDTYKTYLVAEKVNGGTMTDYASAPSEVPIPPKHVHKWATEWNKTSTAHWHECTTNNGTFCDITTDTQKNCYSTHNWGEKIVTTSADCSSKEVYYRDCRDCNYRMTFTGEINPSKHSLVTSISINPTCTTAGKTIRTCTKCSYKIQQDSEPLGHDWDEGVTTIEPTCQNTGNIHYTCTREGCNAIYDEELDTEEHCYASDDDGEPLDPSHIIETKNATCEEEGEIQFLCQWCLQWILEPTDPLGHDFGEWTVIKAATREEPGIKQRICNTCQSIDQAEIPKHVYVENITKAASCGIEGIITYVCSDCGDSYTETIQALTHNYGEWKQTVAPTEKTEGKQERVCNICGNTETKSIPVIKHKHSYKYNEWHTSDTKHWHQCSCGNKDDIDTHTWVKGKVLKAPTDKEKGSIIYTCDICGYQATRSIPTVETVLESDTLLYNFDGTINNRPYVTLLGRNTKKGKKTLNVPGTVTIKDVTYTVNKIGYAAFYKDKNITKITIPSSVTTIEDMAFYRAVNVKSIVIGTGTTEIGQHAFCGLKSLETITLKSKKIKTNKKIFLHGTGNVTIYVPKEKKTAYKKMFLKQKRKNIKVKK